jgi:hypothetical protein
VLRMDGVPLTRDVYTLEEIFHLLPARVRDKGASTTTALAKALRRAGLHSYAGGAPIYTTHSTTCLWPIRNIDRWMKADKNEVRAHYEGAVSKGADPLWLATAKRKRKKDRKFAEQKGASKAH